MRLKSKRNVNKYLKSIDLVIVFRNILLVNDKSINFLWFYIFLIRMVLKLFKRVRLRFNVLDMSK